MTSRGVSKPQIKSALYRRLAQPLRFARVHACLFRAGTDRQWSRFGWLCGCDFISALARASVLSIIVFASRIATGGPGHADGSGVHAWLASVVEGSAHAVGTTPTALAFYGSAIGSTLCLAVSVAASFYAALLARQMARRFHHRQVHGILSEFVAGTYVSRILQLSEKNRLQIGVMQYALHGSRALETIVRALPRAIIAAGFIVAAFVLEWRIMLLLVLFVLLFLPGLLLISRRIHSDANSFFGSSAQGMGRHLAKVLNEQGDVLAPERGLMDLPADFMASSAATKYFSDYDRVLLASERMNFLTGLVRSLIFGVGMFLMTFGLMRGWVDASRLIAFSGALFIAFSYIQTMFSTLASLNLHYPQVVRLLELRGQLGEARTESACSGGPQSAAGLDGPIVIAGQRQVAGVPPTALLGRLELTPGRPVALLTAERPSRFDIGRWLGPVVHASGQDLVAGGVAFFAAKPKDLSPISLAALSEALSAHRLGTLQSFAHSIGMEDAFVDLANTLKERGDEAPLDRTTMKDLKSRTAALLVAVMAATTSARLVVLESIAFAPNADDTLARLAVALGDKFLIVVRTPMQPPVSGVAGTLVITAASRLAIFAPDTSEDVLRAALPRGPAHDDDRSDESALLV